ncbi:MAG: hypothetical protein VX700_10050, partial [Pseudomonadota bacterium]|nr:hypothetical protein [Pseudomonadota bacterium]
NFRPNFPLPFSKLPFFGSVASPSSDFRTTLCGYIIYPIVGFVVFGSTSLYAPHCPVWRQRQC